MTTLNFTKLIDEAFASLEEALTGTAKAPKEPVKENTVPEAPEAEESDWLDDEEFAYLVVGDEVQPAWEAIEALREAETATDNGNHEAAAGYIAIADRYIRLADIFKETEVTFSL